MSWLLGYDMPLSALNEFKRDRGLSEHNAWEVLYKETFKVFQRRLSSSWTVDAAGDLNQVLYFHRTNMKDPQLDFDNPNIAVPTKAQILQLRRLFGRREMWYRDWYSDRMTKLLPRRAIYGDDELDKESFRETVRDRIESMVIKEEEDDAKQSDSKAGRS